MATSPNLGTQQSLNVQVSNIQMKPELNGWNHRLCGCMSNIPGCLASVFCFPCYVCYFTCEMDDMGLCCMSVCTNVLWPIRSYMRGRYNIPGSIHNDYLVTCCCPLCALCQLVNEWNSRHADVGIVYQQTQVVTTVEETVSDTEPICKRV